MCEASWDTSLQVTAQQFTTFQHVNTTIFLLSMCKASSPFTPFLLAISVLLHKRMRGRERKQEDGMRENVIGRAVVSPLSHRQGSSVCSSLRTGCQISGARPLADKTSPCGRKMRTSGSQVHGRKCTTPLD